MGTSTPKNTISRPGANFFEISCIYLPHINPYLSRLSSVIVTANMPSVPTPSKAGIVETNGERHIPSSLRPDGSKRKEIKIRPGYRPPEDVEVYKNRTAEAFRERGKRIGIPGAAGLQEENPPAGSSDQGSAASNKNAKRREARKKAKAAEGGDAGDDTGDKPTAAE